jgi:hypothetical protein
MKKANIALGSFGFILIVGFLVGIYMLIAWGIMLLWGAIAPQFGHQTIGFGLSFLITLALALVASFFSRGKK